MRSCDVLIVGGGPAGSSCAWGLHASGLDIVILDKCKFPRDKLCGGWITPSVLTTLKIDPEAYACGRILQPITGFRVSCMEQREIEIDYDENVSYGIRRCEFDEYLLRRSGAHVLEGVPITKIERVDDGWMINQDIKAQLLVGAGGHFCPISRWVGNTNAAQPVVAQEIEFEMDAAQAACCGIQPEVPEIYFCRDMRGYGWCFRKHNFLNIGLGRLDQHRLSENVGRFVQFLRKTGKLGFDMPARCSGHAYLLFGHSARKIVDDSVMLIGDSAGVAYPQSGEGIRPAIESGLLAARVIHSAAQNYACDRLEHYVELLNARFGGSQGHLESLARHLPGKLRDACARLLLKQRAFCRNVVVENWFLHQGDPALV